MRSFSLTVQAKLCSLVCAIAAVSLGKDVIFSYVLTLVCFFTLIIQKKWQITVTYGLFYILLGILLYLIRYQGLHMYVFSEFYVLMFWNLSPIFLSSWDLMTTPPGELSAFMSRIHMPTSVILGILVVFRFFPTVKSELKSVYLSMKNRGLTGIRHIFRHPLITGEYVLIPFLFRVLMIADQLSVSETARGADTPGIRGSYYEKNMCMADIAIMILWVVVTVAYLWIGGIKI